MQAWRDEPGIEILGNLDAERLSIVSFVVRRPRGRYIHHNAVVALLNEVYEVHTVREPWQTGDLLLVDNIRTAHSREPYTGLREVVVGLADPVRLGETLPDDRSPR